MPDAPDEAPRGARPSSWLDRLPAIGIGFAIVGIALAAYWLPGSPRFYNHFVWQALAFLDGRAAITWPVDAPGIDGNAYFQDVLPVLGPDGQQTGFGLLPFPPLPAIVLMPFVAIWGVATDERLISVVLGAIAAGIAWWTLGRLAISRSIRLATTLFFALGTVFWYAAQLGTTWFFAHVVAVTCLLLAVGVALAGDPTADAGGNRQSARTFASNAAAVLSRPLHLLDGRQVLAGFLFGLACTARLSIVLGAPFFMFVGSGGSWVRRSLSAGLGAAVPIGLLLAYNVVTTGQLVHPAYDYLYHLEATGYPGLNYNPAWSIEDLRYIPQNLRIMFLSTPAFLPDAVPSAVIQAGRPLCLDPGAVRGLFNIDCPLALPRDVGMSVLLTSPAYLLAVRALWRPSRLVIGSVIAVVAIAIFNLMHFSQGWVQFGYRFSNDFVVFAILLVAAGMARRRRVGFLGVTLIGLSIAINAWGVIWGNLQGW